MKPGQLDEDQAMLAASAAARNNRNTRERHNSHTLEDSATSRQAAQASKPTTNSSPRFSSRNSGVEKHLAARWRRKSPRGVRGTESRTDDHDSSGDSKGASGEPRGESRRGSRVTFESRGSRDSSSHSRQSHQMQFYYHKSHVHVSNVSGGLPHGVPLLNHVLGFAYMASTPLLLAVIVASFSLLAIPMALLAIVTECTDGGDGSNGGSNGGFYTTWVMALAHLISFGEEGSVRDSDAPGCILMTTSFSLLAMLVQAAVFALCVTRFLNPHVELALPTRPCVIRRNGPPPQCSARPSAPAVAAAAAAEPCACESEECESEECEEQLIRVRFPKFIVPGVQFGG